MGWANDARDGLLAGQSVVVRPRGGSMRGLIEDGDEVTIEPMNPVGVSVGDVVFVRWKGGFLLHLVKEANDSEFLIGNFLGKSNGWVRRDDVLGRMKVR